MGTELASKIKALNCSLSGQIGTGGLESYHGFALKNVGAGTATVVLYDGPSGNGLILDVINLFEGESASDWYDSGIAITSDTVYAIVTGSIAGSVRIR